MLQYLTIIFVSIRSNNGQLNWAVAPLQWHYVKTHISHWPKSCHDVNFVFMTTSYATSNDKVGILITHGYQWPKWLPLTDSVCILSITRSVITHWYLRHGNYKDTTLLRFTDEAHRTLLPVFCIRMPARYREFIGQQRHNIIMNMTHQFKQVVSSCHFDLPPDQRYWQYHPIQDLYPLSEGWLVLIPRDLSQLLNNGIGS